MKDNTNDNQQKRTLSEQMAFDNMALPKLPTADIAPPNPLFDGNVVPTLTSAMRQTTSSSRTTMVNSHLLDTELGKTEYMNRKLSLLGNSVLNPYADMSPTVWSNIREVMTYLSISRTHFTMTNRNVSGEYGFTLLELESMVPDADLEQLGKMLGTQIQNATFNEITNKGERKLDAEVLGDVSGAIKVQYQLDDEEEQIFEFPAFSSLKAMGESEMRHVSGMADLIKPGQLDQMFPHGHVSDIDSEIFRHSTRSLFGHEREERDPVLNMFILNEVKEIHHTVTRDELTNIKIKHKWFNKLIPREQQMYKVAMLSNNAHTYRAVDCDVPEQWQGRSFEQTEGLVPRYSNSVIQPCNLVFKTDDAALGIYSIYSSRTKREDKCNAMYLRDWSEGLSSKRYYRCEDGKHFMIVDLTDDSVTYIMPGTPEYVLVESKFRVYGNIFAYRLEQYEKKVRDSIPVSITYSKEQVLEEALAWYLEDITADVSKADDEKYLVTCSEALPKLRRYRGELSKPTGRKMSPHDRTSHKNRRYNPDGTIRLEWDVAATEVNGGAKARFGMQISNIVPHLTK